jgi:hypothetical protein
VITLDFSANEETQIFAVAHQVGLAPAEYVMKLVKDHLPPPEISLSPSPSFKLGLMKKPPTIQR